MTLLSPVLRGFIKKEFRQTLRDPRNAMLLFVAPMIQMIVFGYALSSEIKNVRLAVAPSCGDTMLHEISRDAFASGWFIAADASPSKDPFAAIARNKADVVLVPPQGGLTKAIENGRGELQILINAVNVTQAQGIENYLKTIINTALAKHSRSAPPAAAIAFDLRILYNPTMRSAFFLVPGIMGILICLVTIILTSMSVSKEKEQGTFEMLASAPIESREILLGKSIPFVLLGMVNLPLILSTAIFLFGVPMRGSMIVLILATVVFVCVTVAIGILISTISKTQQQSMMGGFIFLLPAVLLSGLMFPLENMPAYMQFFGWLNPLTYYNRILRTIMLKGGDATQIACDITILIVMGIVLAWISGKRFKTTL